ncbi:hypothetical protein LXL04_004285 [Taraxacum kok-saghyz]
MTSVFIAKESEDNISQQDYLDLNDGDEFAYAGNIEESEGSDGNADDKDNDHDEENMIEYMEVDIRDFHMHVDREAEFRETENHRDNEAGNEEYEDSNLYVVDKERFDYIGENSDIGRRRVVLKSFGKEKRCSYGEVHKTGFVEIFREGKKVLKTYVSYILSRP